ncbi:hypothetical protein HRI_001850800 [Hibiscus trionum]|uniref:Uncharacterized protein n=1 Tax=Hibiscus trionum TaxID=183268 RepID=A0A9W7M0Q7_HIBTR|nr:hypothetical protein HRI_001850800 [Hibiscus trionum]
MLQLFKGIASEADALLNDLQSSLYKQEEKLTASAQQQREAHSRAVHNARSISKITVSFFATLDMHASKLAKIVFFVPFTFLPSLIASTLLIYEDHLLNQVSVFPWRYMKNKHKKHRILGNAEYGILQNPNLHVLSAQRSNI